MHGFNPYRPETLTAGLAEVGSKTDAVILVGVDNPDVAAEISVLSARGVRVVSIVSEVSSSAPTIYVGQDNFVSGKTAARLMLGFVPAPRGTVAILIGHLQFRHLLDRRSGFEQLLALNCPDLTPIHVRPYGDDASGIGPVLEELRELHPDLVGVYLCGGGQPEIYGAVKALEPGVTFIAHEVTERSRAALADGSLTAVVASDIAEICRLAVDAALSEAPVQSTFASIRIHVPENLPHRPN
jgi:LacI family transcriptional regulator